MKTYTGYTGTKIEIQAENLDEAYQKLIAGDYFEVEVESWIEDGDDTYDTNTSTETK